MLAGRKLEGRRALVTGSTSGLGAAIARLYAGAGARVVISGRDADRGAAVVDEIRRDGGWASFVAADLAQDPWQAARTLAEHAADDLEGAVDLLVNNAGVVIGAFTPDVQEADFDALLAVNVKAAWALTARLAPVMARHGDGVVLNMGSIVAGRGGAGIALYAASKAALHALTRAWSAEWGPKGVRVNALAPGYVITEAVADRRAALEQAMSGTPAGRPGSPEDVAQAALHLASSDSAYVHGTVMTIDGGATMML